MEDLKKSQELTGIEEEETNILPDENPMDDIPGIAIHIGDNNNMQVQLSGLYHDSTNGKIALLKNNPALQDVVMKAIQIEVQKAFRKAIHGVLGIPYGLKETKQMKKQINEIKRMQHLAGILKETNESFNDQPRPSFYSKFKDVDNPQEFINKFHIEPNNPLTKIVSRYIGNNSNFAITNDNGKFNVYEFRQTAKPGDPVGTFNTIDDAKRAIQSIDK